MRIRKDEPTGHHNNPRLGGFIPDLSVERVAPQHTSIMGRIKRTSRTVGSTVFGGVLTAPSIPPPEAVANVQEQQPTTPAPLADTIQVVEVQV